MAESQHIQHVRKQLFGEPGQLTYVVLDGASVPDLPQVLWEHEPEHVCLFRGELAPDMAEVAPYLVALDPDAAFTQWVLAEGWGAHWGIFIGAAAALPFRELRKHFRQFLMVKDAKGEPMYFRYYDPRVLEAFLPTCDEAQLDMLFGPVLWYLIESDQGEATKRLSLVDGELAVQTLDITPVTAKE